MMNELIKHLADNHISYKQIDNEVVDIDGLGQSFLTDLSEVKSIFRTKGSSIEFNILEDPNILIEESVFYTVFKFGDNWYYFDLRGDFKLNLLKYLGVRDDYSVDYNYINLGAHTQFELLNGSFSVEEWIQKAKHLGQNAIGTCDKHTMANALLLQKACKSAGIKHVFGYTLECLVDVDTLITMKVYCQSQQGLKNLLRIQSTINVDNDSKYIDFSDLLKYGEGNVLVVGTLGSKWVRDNPKAIYMLKESFIDIMYQFDVSEFKANRFDIEVLESIKTYIHYIYQCAPDYLKPVLICDNYYLDKSDAKNKVILNKIGERTSHKESNDQYFKTIDEHIDTIKPLFSDKWDVDTIIQVAAENTYVIADGANASFETSRMFMPEYIMKPEEIEKYGTRKQLFLRLLDEGLDRLVAPEDHDVYRERMEDEVYIIESTNNIDYFLIQWDMTNEARRRDIAVGIGRGSAGGSLVSYLLGIISVNPIKFGLIFSRFLVPERCGLEWSDVTCLAEDITINKGDEYIEIDTPDGVFKFEKDSELLVSRDGKTNKVYADELVEGDEIIWDNKDILWSIPEIVEANDNISN
ncbi:MAG: PHP domain-containing protein [Bacteroidales bacterium]